MPDVYFKKTLDFYHNGQAMQFHVAQDLFSSHQIDVGTARLLHSLDSERSFHKVLDLGCGYGPLGLTLKKLAPQRDVHLIDRDALAVDYTRQNAAFNGIADVSVYGSLGYDDVTARDFDLIISNIPGKAGEAVITSLLRDAGHVLAPGGMVAIVVVAPLAELVTNALADPDIDVIFQETRSGHAIFHYQFSAAYHERWPAPESAFARGLYHRDNVTMSTAKVTYAMQTARGLPEFDSLDFTSALLFKGLIDVRGKRVNRALVFNPGQGHLPVVLWKLAQPRQIDLVDRDLLSLRYTQANLILNKCPDARIATQHRVGLPDAEPTPQTDLIAGFLREEEGQAAAGLMLQQAAVLLVPGGDLWIAAGSTAVTRVEKLAQADKAFRVEKRKRDRGKSLLVLRRR